jgi:hypothetical protein
MTKSSAVGIVAGGAVTAMATLPTRPLAFISSAFDGGNGRFLPSVDAGIIQIEVEDDPYTELEKCNHKVSTKGRRREWRRGSEATAVI